MKFKISAYHIISFLYRRGYLILTLPLQSLFLKHTNRILSAYVYLTDIILLAGIIICGFAHYKAIRFFSSDSTLSLKEGIVLKKHNLLPHKKIKKLHILQGPVQKFMGVCRLTIHCGQHKTNVYIKTDPEFSIFDIFGKDKKPQLSIKSNLASVLLLSLGFYNAFTGALTLIPFFRKTYLLLSASKNHPTQLIPSFVYTKLPLLLFCLSAFILLLWGMGIALNIMRYAQLTLEVNSTSVKTSAGIIIKRTSYIPKEHICAIVFKQNLLFILINLITGEFLTSCKKKDSRTIFLCAGKRRICLSVLKHLKTFSKKQNNSLTLRAESVFGYTYLPLSILLLFSVLLIIADKHFTYISKTRIGLFVVLFLVGWFFFRLCIFSRCFASLNHNFVIVGFYHGLTYSIAYIPKDKIRRVTLSESVFQRRKHNCSLLISIQGHKSPIFLKHTKKEKAAEFLSKLCGQN